MLRARALIPLFGLLMGCEPGHSLVVSHVVTEPVGRACAADALGADTTFSVTDTIDARQAREITTDIGSFRWRSPSGKDWETGSLYHRYSAGRFDTVVASASWLGARPSNADLRFAAQELSTRSTLLVDRCSRSVAPAVCTFQTTGHPPVDCSRL